MRRESRKVKNNMIIGALCAVVMIMAVAYALANTSLNVNTTTNISSTWNILITDVRIDPVGQATDDSYTYDKLDASFNTHLVTPEDSMVYHIDVTNNGNLDATLTNIKKKITNKNKYININFSGFTKGEILKKGETKTVDITVSFDYDEDGSFTETVETGINISLDFAQQGTNANGESPDKYLVTYDCTTNGGTTCSDYNEYLETGKSVNLEYTSEKKGYKFVGWNTYSTATEGLESLEVGTEDITLYAIYKEPSPLKQSLDFVDRSSITEIEIVDLNDENITAPEIDNNTSWDASADNDKSIVAWLEGTKLYIGGEDGVIANPNSNSLFSYFTSLKTIDLELLNTSNVTNMGYMFYNCNNLTTLDLSNFITSKVESMGDMFRDCTNLLTLDVSNFDTSKVTSMSDMFTYCSKLTELNLSNFNTPKLSDVGGMFYECRSLTELDISNFDTSNVTEMTNMFYGCSNLTSLDVSNFDTSNATRIGAMFGQCGNLTTLDVSDFDTSKVTDMGMMFYNCSSLTTLDLSNFDTSKVTEMYQMFQGCYNLKTIYASEKFVTTNVTNSNEMFSSCNNLVGGNGTIYDSNYTDATYARMDTQENPGYFTDASDSIINGIGTTSTIDSINVVLDVFTSSTAPKITKYEYSKDGGLTYEEGTDGTYTFNNLETNKTYQVKARVTNNLGKQTESETKRVYVGGVTFSEETKTKVIDNGIETTNDTTYPWVEENGVWKSSNQSIDNSSTTLSFNLTLSETKTLSFDWSVSSESVSFDYVYYTIIKDGNILSDTGEQTKIGGTEYGSDENSLIYTTITKELEAGDYTISFTYRKDGSAANGTDTAYIKNVKIDDKIISSGILGRAVTITYPNGCTNGYTCTYQKNDEEVQEVTDTTAEVFFEESGNLIVTVNDGSETHTYTYTVVMEEMELSMTSTRTMDSITVTTNAEVNSGIAKYEYSKDNGNTWVKGDNTYTFKGLTPNTKYPIKVRVTSTLGTIKTISKNINTKELKFSTKATINSITVITKAESNSKITKYEYSKDGGRTWVEGNDSTYTFTKLTHNTEYKVAVKVTLSSGATITSSTKNITTAELPIPTYSEELKDSSRVVTITYSSKCKNEYTCTYKVNDGEEITVTNSTAEIEFTSGGSILAKVKSEDNQEVNSSYTVNIAGVMKHYDSWSSEVFYAYKDQITEVEVIDLDNTNLTVPNIDNNTSWDVSTEENGQIIAWLDGTKLYIGGPGGVLANPDLSYMFSNFTNLKTVDLELLDTSRVTNMDGMFTMGWSGTSNKIENLDLSSFDTSNVKTMNDMFGNCSNLKSIDVSNFDTSNVTSMYSMFRGCKSLNSIDINGFNTSNVTNMSYMFYECTSLISLDISSWNTSKVTDMSIMFRECKNLSTLDVSNFDTSKVTTMMQMFYLCNNLIKLDVSNWDTSKVTSFDSTFDGENDSMQLTELDVSNWDTSNVKSLQNTFKRCSHLKLLDVSNWDTSKVTDMQNTFYGCANLTKLDVSNWNTSKVTNMNYLFGDCSVILSLDVSNWDTSKVTDMNNMFIQCYELDNLDVSNFDTTNVTNMRQMFYNCRNLTSLDVSNFNTSNVTSMQEMFAQCFVLDSLDLSSFNTSKVTNMSGMFRSCQKLIELDINNFDTSKVTDMNQMFDNCGSLTELDVSNFDTSKVTNMYQMFISCSNLTILDISNFDTSNVTDMEYMFNECSSLTSLDVSNFNTQNVTNMQYMFYNCYELKTIYASDKFVTTKVTSSDSMFSSCNNLVGGNGTIYDSNYTDATYARIDTTENPGYFTDASEPIINSLGTTSTTNSINVVLDVFTSSTAPEITKYEYSKDGGLTYEEGTGSTYTFNNLETNKTYQVKARITNNLGKQTESKTKRVYVGGIKFNDREATTEEIINGGAVKITNDVEHPWVNTNGIWNSTNTSEENNTANLTFSFILTEASTLSFDYAASAYSYEYGYAYYTIAKDGNILDGTGIDTQKCDMTSYEENLSYETVTKQLEAGTYTLTFSYHSHYSWDAYLKTGYVKNLTIGNLTKYVKNAELVSIEYPDGCTNGYTCTYQKNSESPVGVISGTENVLFTESGTLIATVNDGNETHSYTYTVVIEEMNLSMESTRIADSITVTTNAEVNSGITKYEYSKDNGNTWVESTNSYTFTDLTPKTKYPIKVRITSGLGTIKTISKNIYTTDIYFLAKPTSNSITIIKNAEVTSEVSKYEYSKDGGTTWEESNNSTYTFTELTHNTEYQVLMKLILTSGTELISSTRTVKTTLIDVPTYNQSDISNASSDVTIIYPEGCGSKYTCTYQKDSEEEITATSSKEIVNFSSTGTIIAKITDGTNTIVSSTYTVILGTYITIGNNTYLVSASTKDLHTDPIEEERYVYSGENPNNYIIFNEEIWRILAIETDGKLKIIRNTSIGYKSWDENYDRNNSSNYIASWASASLNSYLNEEYYESLNNNAQNLLDSNIWNVGTVSYNSLNSLEKIVSSEKRTTYNGKIGIISISDYLKANSNSNCTNANYIYNSSGKCTPTNYTFKLSNIFLQPRSNDATWYTDGIGSIGGALLPSGGKIYPVVFLKSDITLSGKGTSTNPYTIVS